MLRLLVALLGLVLFLVLPFSVREASASTCVGIDEAGQCTGIYDSCPTSCPLPDSVYCVGIHTDACEVGLECRIALNGVCIVHP